MQTNMSDSKRKAKPQAKSVALNADSSDNDEKAQAISDKSEKSEALPAKPIKRSRSAGEETEDFGPDDFAKMSRSERKRHREKKRRSDVNKGFDELMTLLLEIDPSVRAEAEERARRGQWKGSFGAQEDNLLSRVDLINRTVDVLRRLHRENEERKLIIASLTQSNTGVASLNSPEQQLQQLLQQQQEQKRQQQQPSLQQQERMTGIDQVERLMLQSATGEAAALRAAVGSSHLLNQNLLASLTGNRSSAVTGHLADTLNLPQAASLQLRARQDNLLERLALANAAQLPAAALGLGRSSETSQNNPSMLLSPGLAGRNQANTGEVSALTRRYLELMQSREYDVLSSLAGGGSANAPGDLPNVNDDNLKRDHQRFK